MTLNLEAKRKDLILVFITRILRMFSYGMIAVIFIQNLIAKKFKTEDIGFIQSAIIFGDIIISLVLTTKADAFGRKNTLIVGSFLMMITGLAYANLDNNLPLLILSGIVGVISVTGGEIGPFLAL
jgi:MFS family permease